MKWGFRWYGESDPIPLEYVKQIPNVKGVVGTLLNKLPGDVWEIEEIRELQKSIQSKGMELLGIESVSINDAIKAGTEERDYYIDNYIQTIRNLAACGINLICYSFKPIFGWAKTDLNYELDDGSRTLMYDEKVVQSIEPAEMFNLITSQTGDFDLSGWEAERFEEFNDLLEMYKDISEDDLRENLKYFLDKVIPVCEECDVYMGIHPDDPPWEMFGFPRITKNLDDLKKILALYDSPHNGITLCTGSLGARPENDLIEIINEIGDHIHFVHFRNVMWEEEQKFYESAHPSNYGSLDMYKIMEALINKGFSGVIRPDHGRNIWGENPRPGYGLYDRALGITYAIGLEEAIKKSKNK